MNLNRLKRGIKNPYLTARFAQDQLIDRFYGKNDGIYVMEQDWDNLIILDACRYDVFNHVNTLSGTLSAVTSRGGATAEFIRENFSHRHDYDTIFISGNAVVGSCIEDIDVYKLVGLWGDSIDTGPRSDRDNNVSPSSVSDPGPVVEKTLQIHQQYPDKRLISHLLPPHTPYLMKDGDPIPEDSPYRTLDVVREGKIPSSEIRSVYRENVEYVLEYVEQLLDELDGKTVITADHGELLGEGVPWPVRLLHARWNLGELYKFDYGHYNRVHEPELVTVPWLEIEADSRRDISTEDEPVGIEMDESAIKEQLAALGYR